MGAVMLAYGAHCSWWGSLDEAERRPSGTLVCPECHQALYRTTEKDWWDGVDRKTRIDDPHYRKFIEWLRGRCFTGPNFFEEARALYDVGLEEPDVPTQAQLLAVYAAVHDPKWDQRDWHTRAVIDQLRKAGSNV